MENCNSNSLHGVYTRVDKDGKSDGAGEYILFGSYPISRVCDEALIAELNALAGELPTNGSSLEWTSYKYYMFNNDGKDFMWYIDVENDGAMYRGVYFSDYRPNEAFNTSKDNYQEGNGYLSGVAHWFKYEPIKWKILEERDGKAWLLSDVCLDSQTYRDTVWENSYVKSSIRQWLNNNFLNTAFDECEKAAISREVIENIMEYEDVCDGDKPGSDTFDLIHLLSSDEVLDMLKIGKRQSSSTDYARCQGILVYADNGYSEWWTRTPYYTIESWAEEVGPFPRCDITTGDIDCTYVGTRPALWLKL